MEYKKESHFCYQLCFRSCLSAISKDTFYSFPSLVNLSCWCLGIITLWDLLLSVLSGNMTWHQQATVLSQTESQGLGINYYNIFLIFTWSLASQRQRKSWDWCGVPIEQGVWCDGMWPGWGCSLVEWLAFCGAFGTSFSLGYDSLPQQLNVYMKKLSALWVTFALADFW